MSTGMTYSTSVGSRWKRVAAIPATSCTTSRVASLVSAAVGHHWRRHRSHQSQKDGAAAQLAPQPMELELDQFMEVHHGMLVKLTRKMEPQLSSLSASRRSLHNTLPSVCWRKKRRPHGYLVEVGDDDRLKDEVGREVLRLEAELLQRSTKKDEIGSANPQARLETKSTNSPAERSPRGGAPT
jgi:hypothetical protein